MKSLNQVPGEKNKLKQNFALFPFSFLSFFFLGVGWLEICGVP